MRARLTNQGDRRVAGTVSFRLEAYLVRDGTVVQALTNGRMLAAGLDLAPGQSQVFDATVPAVNCTEFSSPSGAPDKFGPVSRPPVNALPAGGYTLYGVLSGATGDGVPFSVLSAPRELQVGG